MLTLTALWVVWVMSLPAAAGLVVHVVMFIDSNPPLVYGVHGLEVGQKSYMDWWR